MAKLSKRDLKILDHALIILWQMDSSEFVKPAEQKRALYLRALLDSSVVTLTPKEA